MGAATTVSIVMNLAAGGLNANARVAEKSLNKLEKSTKKLGDTAASVTAKTTALEGGVNKVSASFFRQRTAARGATKSLADVVKSTEKVSLANKKAERSIAEVAATAKMSYSRIRREVQLTATEMAALQKLQGKFYADRFKSAGSGITRTGMVAGTVGGAALYGIGSTALSFERGMNKANALMPGASDADKEMLRQEVLRLGANSPKTSAEIAQGLVQMAMAGIKPGESKKLLEPSTWLSVATGEDMGVTTDILTNIGNVFGEKDYEKVADRIAAAVTNTNMTVIDMAQSMKYAGAVAHSYGQGLEETTAAIMSMAQAGIKADMAGTGIQRIMNAFANPDKGDRKALARLGLKRSDFINADGSSVGIIEIVKKFRAAQLDPNVGVDKVNQVLNKVFAERGGLAIMTLLGRPEEEMNAFLKTLNESKGTVKTMSKEMMKGLPGAVDRATSAINNLVLSIAGTEGQGRLTDWIISFGNDVTWLTGVLNDNPFLDLATSAVLAAVGLGAVLLPLGMVFSAIGSLKPLAARVMIAFSSIAASAAAPFLAVGAIIGVVAYTVYQHLGGIWEWLKTFAFSWKFIVDGFVTMLLGIGNLDAGQFTTGIMKFAYGFLKFFGQVVVGGVINMVGAFWDTLTSLIGMAVPDFLQNSFGRVIDWIGDKIKSAIPEWMLKAWNWVRGDRLGGTEKAAAAVTDQETKTAAVAPKNAATEVAKAASASATTSPVGQAVVTTGQAVAKTVAETGKTQQKQVETAAKRGSDEVTAAGVELANAIRSIAAEVKAASAAFRSIGAAPARAAAPAGLAPRLGNAMIDH